VPGIDPLSDAKVIDSWRRNAEAWTTAVRERQIESRRLVTDAAVQGAVESLAPRLVLDLGCGEGWLARALAASGIQVTGVDVVPELVEQATQRGGGTFLVMSYEDIAAGRLVGPFDAVVANFSLIGGRTVDDLVHGIPRLLAPSGSLVIQTVHPIVACGDLPYKDGWRPGSWTGFSSDFVDPAPWYFRTMESWESLITGSGLTIRSKLEPMNPTTGKPASLIFIAQR